MTLQQAIVWTALPNGWATPGSVMKISVFVAPRLSSSPTLTPYSFANWPSELAHQHGGHLNFTVTFQGHAPVKATVTSATPSASEWSALFQPSLTAVDGWTFEDLSTAPLHSYSAAGVADFVQRMYTAVAGAGATVFPEAGLLWKYIPARNNDGNGGPGWSNVKGALAFHQLPSTLPSDTVHDPRTKLTAPIFDFHQSISSLQSYPGLMRQLGLVFDLEVHVPGGLGASPNVKVAPAWNPKLSFPGSVDVSPWTSCLLTAADARARPRGPDYANGMLNLADTSRFTVSGLDTDGVADRLQLLSTQMEQTNPSITSRSSGTPALRTAGMEIIWTGWAEQPSKGPGLDLADRLATQKANNALIEAYIPTKSGPLPVLHAEDVIRGHYVDVFTASETAPAWYSLCWRVGTYALGPSGATVVTITDEGAVAPGATRPHNLVRYDGRTGAFGAKVPDPPDLYVHERLARWKGWSLVAPRPGKSGVGSGTDLQDGGTNPVPPGTATASPPQLSVVASAPTTGTTLLPKLRFGSLYRLRARGADLAGNAVPASSADASSASPTGAHVRWEPVAAPQLAPIAPPVPGEGTELMVILNQMTDPATPVTPNGRWVFAPKVSQFLCEEHGMLDGFVEGSPPDPTQPPSGTATTYGVLATRDPLRLNDVSGVQFYGSNPDSTGSPGVGSPYFPGATELAVPWLPDPLASGLCLFGLPTKAGFVTRFYNPVLWPDPAPLLLQLDAGTTFAEAYTAPTSGVAAVETITLPPGETLVLGYSSSLYPGSSGPKGQLRGLYMFGIWQWMAEGGLTSSTLEEAANAGLVWQLSPPRLIALVHAVRLPLVEPAFGAPTSLRALGSTKATIVDTTFTVDTKSTSSLDFLAAWTDPIDDLALSAPSTASFSAAAFKLTVDEGAFELETPDATQDFGDTKHHSVDYSAIGTSRFNGFFRQDTTVTFSGETPVELSSLGLDAASVRLSIPATSASELVFDLPAADFVVDASAGTVALTSSGVTDVAGRAVDVSWIPTDTLAGPPSTIPVLSTARPVAPTILRIVPSWQLIGPTGTVSGGSVLLSRRGNFLRVYVSRPWYSTGAGELLGVVTRTDSALPTTEQLAYTTVVGADPIYDALFAGWGSFTGITNLTNLTSVPSVPGHPAYGNPPELTILEDTSGALYRIWPYAVNFDSTSGSWFADVQLSFGDQSIVGPDGAYPPMFVRLALARFQPWSLAGVEVSPVVLASIAQPVPDRIVLVTPGTESNTVQVRVEGFGYAGFRPAAFNTAEDPESGISPTQDVAEVYGGPTMVVEVQVQDNPNGLSGDFGWSTVPTLPPVALDNPGDNGPFVSWSGTVPLPPPSTEVPTTRLRISEVDFYTGGGAPSIVDTTLRRPFVAFIPIE